MDMWTLCEKYPAYYNLQHSVTYNSDVQWNILHKTTTHIYFEFVFTEWGYF